MKLHQFTHCVFCEKVRLVLAVKRLPYTVVEVLPGLGQLELLRQCGSRQVPVLEDGAQWIADSTAIALHLERIQPDPPLLPRDPAAAAEVRLLEDWADTALAAGVRQAVVKASVAQAPLRRALLPEAIPEPFRGLAGGMPIGWLEPIAQLLPAGGAALADALDAVITLLQSRPWLVGDGLSLADLALAAQLYGLRFPDVAGPALVGRGVPGIADQARFDPLFRWRDNLYQRIGRSASPPGEAPPLSIPVE